MILAIDFDGVIHDWEHPKPGRKMGPPMPGAAEAIRRLKQQGHQIIIHSCNRVSVIADWCKYFDVPYDSIWAGVGKPAASVYVDDRALKFVDWESTYRELQNL